MMAPILLITFNRPDYLQRVLQVLLRIKPKELFIFQDGPRGGNLTDSSGCEKVRWIIKRYITWPCNMRTFYSEKNLGCGPGPATAISWFFSQVNQGIIIEDDTVPHEDFFYYATELLDRYKDDKSVYAIGSMNVDRQRWGDGSYYFSMMNRNLCAWATWSRAWNSFDINMKDVSRCRLSQALRKYNCVLVEREYWCDRLDEIHKDGCNGKSWDMQFFMSIWLNGGKGIIPNVNLSSNIGTVGDATHSMEVDNIIDNVPTHPILPLTHPSSDTIQYEADREFHFLYFEPSKEKWKWYQILYYLINKKVKKFVGHQGPWIKRKRER